MIRLESIQKSFGEQRVLQDLSLEIPSGRITHIIGRSGEGKSVLLKIILGLVKPDAGKVWIEDQDFLAMPDTQRTQFRKRFGMLFQNAALFDSMNVIENVAFPLREHTSLSEAEIQSRVEEMLSQVGLKGVGPKWPSELSGGMRKRVGLARALILEPKIILYDEPTTGLDPLLTDSVDKLIVRTQNQFNLTTIVVSHDIQASLRYADKIAMLHEGQILEQGPPEVFRGSSHPFVQRFLAGRASEGFIG